MTNRYIFKKKVFDDYTVLANRLVKDKKLSWQARGLLVYLLSKPDNWTVTKMDLTNQSPVGGDAVATILKELETACYIKREKFRNELGQWDWRTFVYDEPYTIPLPTTHGSGGNIVSTDIPSTNTKPTHLEAMLKYSKSDPNDIDPLVGYPVDVIDLLRVYVGASGHRPITSEKGDWIKSAREWRELGATAGGVANMYAYAVKNWDVARPGSITRAYRMMKSSNTACDEDVVIPR